MRLNRGNFELGSKPLAFEFTLLLGPLQRQMNWMAIMQDDVANRLVRKLELKQTPGKDAMKEFVERTRALQGEGRTTDQAAIHGCQRKILSRV